MYSNFLLESILYEDKPTKQEKEAMAANETSELLYQLFTPLQKQVSLGATDNFEASVKSLLSKAEKILSYKIKVETSKDEKASLESLKRNLTATFDLAQLRTLAKKALEENGNKIKKLDDAIKAAFAGKEVFGNTRALVDKISNFADGLSKIVSYATIEKNETTKKTTLEVKDAKNIVYNGFVRPYLQSLEKNGGAKGGESGGTDWKKIGLIIALFIFGAILIYFSLKMSGVTVTGFASVMNAVEEVMSFSFVSAFLFLLGVAMIGYGLYLTFKPLIMKLINKIRAWWDKRKQKK